MITRADWLVLACALLLLPLLYAHYWSEAGTAIRVRIAASGQPEIELPLDTPRRIEVHGPLGDSVVEIKNGRVRFVSSSCRGLFCVFLGWLAFVGVFAACLPFGALVSIEGALARFDSINF